MALPPMMTPEEGRQFKERWRLVNEHTAREARQKTPAERLAVLGRLYAAAKVMSAGSGVVAERQSTFEVWRKLRERSGV